MPSKLYSIRLTELSMGLVDPGETLSSRVNAIMVRYAWLTRIERTRVLRKIRPEAWHHLAKQVNLHDLKYMRPSRYRISLIDALRNFPADARSVELMSSAEIICMMEIVEGDSMRSARTDAYLDEVDPDGERCDAPTAHS